MFGIEAIVVTTRQGLPVPKARSMLMSLIESLKEHDAFLFQAGRHRLHYFDIVGNCDILGTRTRCQ